MAPSGTGPEAVVSGGPGKGPQLPDLWPGPEEGALWEVLGKWVASEAVWEP